MARMMKGALGAWVIMAKDRWQTCRREAAADAMSAAMMDGRRSAALKQLKGIMARMMKGASGAWVIMAKDRWQTSRREAAADAMSAAMMDGRRSAALKQLK